VSEPAFAILITATNRLIGMEGCPALKMPMQAALWMPTW